MGESVENPTFITAYNEEERHQRNLMGKRHRIAVERERHNQPDERVAQEALPPPLVLLADTLAHWPESSEYPTEIQLAKQLGWERERLKKLLHELVEREWVQIQGMSPKQYRFDHYIFHRQTGENPSSEVLSQYLSPTAASPPHW